MGNLHKMSCIPIRHVRRFVQDHETQRIGQTIMDIMSSRGVIDIRAGEPRPVKLELCDKHDYLTFAGECDCASKARKTRYAVIGTAYGWLHTTGGDIRMWRSASGARRAAKLYCGI